MSNQSPETTIGGWSNWDFDLDAAALKSFEQAVGSHIGVSFKNPICYAARPTPVDNFVYLCEGTTSDKAETINLYLLHISSLSGKSSIYSATIVDPEANNLPGGFVSWSFPVSDDTQKLFEEAMDWILGVDYVSYGNTSQVVAGTRYVFVAKGTPTSPISPDTLSFPALVTIVKSLGGEVQVSHISRIEVHADSRVPTEN